MVKVKRNINGRGPASIAYKHGEVALINGRRVPTAEYRTWQMMRNRCLNKNAIDWRYYGGRGIRIDPRWSDFRNFLEDMGRRPWADYTLERIDNNKGYTRSNCIWASRATQAHNRNDTKLSPAKTRAIRRAYVKGNARQVDLAKRYGVSQGLISQIIRGVAWK